MALQVDQLRWMAEQRAATRSRTSTSAPASRSRSASGTPGRTAWPGLGRAPASGGVTASSLHLEGDHVLRWIIAYAAIHKAGAVAVPTNVPARRTRADGDPRPRRTGRRDHLRRAGAGAGTEASSDLAPLRLVLAADDDDAWSARSTTDDDAFQVPVDDGDLADIMYTSGTTGLPKGIAVRHRNTHLIPNGEPPWSGDAWIHASPLSTLRRHLLRLQPDEDGACEARTSPGSTSIVARRGRAASADLRIPGARDGATPRHP